MATPTTTTDVVQQRLRFVRDEYLKRWSTHAFKMEYGGYLSNHLLHGLVALGELGASESFIEDFARRYTEKLRAVEEDEVTVPMLTLDDAKALVGKRQNFEGLRAMYEAEVKRLTPDGAVARHLPKLVGGLAGALLHGIIQLGYGYHVGGDLLVAEGLAYLHFSYLSFDAPDDDQEFNFQSTEPFTREVALETARAAQQNQALLDILHDHVKTPIMAQQVQGYLQHRMMCISSDAARGNVKLFGAIQQIVDGFDFSGVNGHVAVDFAMWLFNIAPINDFVLLHALTSAWSLQQVEHLLSPHDRIRAWKVWFRVALGALAMHEIPLLPAQDPTDEAEMTLASLPEWDEILSRTLALEGDVDEHVYKLVQVAYEVSQHNNANPSPFLTPTQREVVMRQSALKVISTEFDIRGGIEEP